MRCFTRSCVELFALAAIALVVAHSGCSRRDQGQSARERAVTAIEYGELRAALDALDDFDANRPDTPEALIEFATLLIRAGAAPRAVWVLEDGLRRFPDRVDVRLSLADAALLLDDPARALSHLRDVSPASEQYERVLLARARAELELGDLDAALARFAEAERRYPESPQARLWRAHTLLEERRLDEARHALETARAAFPDGEDRSVLHRTELALYLAWLASGEIDLALEGLDRLVREAPHDVLAWQGFARAHLLAGRADLALDRLIAALAEDADRLALYPLAAAVYLVLGEVGRAEQALAEFAERAGSSTAHLGLAQFYATRGDRDRARTLYRELATRFPDDADVHFSRAETLLSWGHIQEAKSSLRAFRGTMRRSDLRVEYLEARFALAEGDAEGARRRLQQVVPRLDTAVTQYWLGAALEAQGDRVGADRRYRAAVQRAPASIEAHRALIRLAEERGAWSAAAAHASAMVKLLPWEFDGWSALCDALTRLGRAREAERAARAARERFPDRVEPAAQLARGLAAQGRHREALEEIDAALDRHGPMSELVAERCLVLGMAGRTDEALAAADAALGRDPDSARLHLTRAMLLFTRDRAEAGARAVDRALALDPEDPWPLRVRAEYRVSAGLLEHAREDALRYLERRPDDARVNFLLGVVCERSDDVPGAIEAYRRAAELDANEYLARNNLAELLAREGDVEAGLKVAQEAYRIAADEPHVLDTLGNLYLLEGNPERAIHFLEGAHEAQPEWPETRIRLARAYEAAGRSDDARRLRAGLPSADDAPEPGAERSDETPSAHP